MKDTFVIALAFCLLSGIPEKVISLSPDKNQKMLLGTFPEINTEYNNAIVYNVTSPFLEYYPPNPNKAVKTKTAVVIAPGGGFQFLAHESEGRMVAKYLANNGISCFVLKYRLNNTKTGNPQQELAEVLKNTPEGASYGFHSIISLATEDGIKAIEYVRKNASYYGIAPDKIGFMGFSAGGTVVMSVAQNASPGCAPDFIAPIYAYYREVDGNLPRSTELLMPAFVLAATDDDLKMHTHSISIYNQLIAAGQKAELHLLATGGHGFGMRIQNKSSDNWMELFMKWLKQMNYLAANE